MVINLDGTANSTDIPEYSWSSIPKVASLLARPIIPEMLIEEGYRDLRKMAIHGYGTKPEHVYIVYDRAYAIAKLQKELAAIAQFLPSLLLESHLIQQANLTEREQFFELKQLINNFAQDSKHTRDWTRFNQFHQKYHKQFGGDENAPM